MSWLKRLFFGVESTAKSGANKGKEALSDAADASKERIQDIQKDLSQSVDKASDKMDAFFDDIGDKAKTGVDKAGEQVGEVTSKVSEKAEHLKKEGAEMLDNVSEKANEVTEDLVEMSDAAWAAIEDKGGKIVDKVRDTAEEIGGKIEDKMSDLMEKAEADKAREAAEDAKHPTGIYEGTSHNEKLEGTDLMTGTNDFFEKAAAFADGDYDAVKDEKMTITQLEADAGNKVSGEVQGFEDRDGDGDALIDEAQIVEDVSAEVETQADQVQGLLDEAEDVDEDDTDDGKA